MEIDSTSECSSVHCDLDNENVKEKHSELSDTDSALSSVNTIVSKDSIETSQSVYEGEIVWGSFRQTSWFPCLVYPAANPSDADKVLVKYFNYNGLSACLRPRNVFEFEGVEEFWHEITQIRGIKRSKVAAFTKSCKRAIEQAKLFKTFPICDRITLLDKITEMEKKFVDQKELEMHVDKTIEEVPMRENLKFFFRTMKSYDETEELLEKITIKKEIKSEQAVVKKVKGSGENKESVDSEAEPKRR